jgi:transposase
VRTLKELARSYLAVTQDLTRVMNRLKALYRSWAIPCAGERVYAPRHRNEWLAKITEAGVRRRAEFYYQQLDALQSMRQQVDGICWRRARSTAQRICCARFLRSVRSGRPC